MRGKNARKKTDVNHVFNKINHALRAVVRLAYLQCWLI